MLALRRLGQIALAGLIVLAAPVGGRAQDESRRVVVESIRGPQGGGLRRLLIRSLQDQAHIELVEEAEAKRTAEALGIRGRWTAADYAHVAQELNVDAFLDGVVRRQRRRWGLTIRVRSGADGTRVGSASWGGRTASTLRAVRRSGYARLESYLQATQAPAPVVSEEPAEEEEGWYDDEAPPEELPSPDLADESEDAYYDEDPEEEEDEESGDLPEGYKQYEGLSLRLLFNTLSRDFAATPFVAGCLRLGSIPPDCTAAGAEPVEDDPHVYSGSGLGHVELGFQGELYPGALLDDRPFPWLGVLFAYRGGVGLQVSAHPCNENARDCVEPAPGQDRIPVDATQRELYVAGRGRYNLWFGDRALRLHADVGWGSFRFWLNRDDLLQLDRREIIPPFDYQYVQVGLGIGIDLVPVYLRARVDFGGRFGLRTDQAGVWGTQASSNGMLVGVELRTDAPYVVPGAFFGVEMQWFRFRTDFRGQTVCQIQNAAGQCESDRVLWEPFPYSQDDPNVLVAGAGLPDPVDDKYLRLGLFVGYEFGTGD